MCGLVGLVGDTRSFISDKAISLLLHRGPNTQGSYSNENTFLAHTRLSIQDLSSKGSQPMTSEDGRYTLVYNGEIYNHLELRKTLTPGISYNGHSDTETLLKIWTLHGKSVLPKLNGFFAFAIYDRSKGSLLLARDRFGIKPLYYFNSTSTFAFASELKAIKDFFCHDKSLDFRALSDYLTLLYSTGDKTPFKNIKRLLPGHFLEISTRQLQISNIENFFNDKNSSSYNFQTEDQWIEELEYRLSVSVKRQLLSDIPIGFFLSGGIDSSSIATFARKHIGKYATIEAFVLDSLGLSKQEGFEEDIDYAKAVALQLGANLNVIPTSLDLLNQFDSMVWHLDEPMADAAALNMGHICKVVCEKGYKVLLSGTGADELFGGYRRHQALRFESALEKLPNFLKSSLRELGNVIPSFNPPLRRGKKILNTITLDKEERLISYHDWLNFSFVLELFHQDISEELKNNYHPHAYFRHLADGKQFSNDLELMLAWERSTYLSDNGLLYTDKMSMMHGVEVRVPFLDNELVEFCNQIPANLKIKGNTSKYILKKMMELYLPKEIIYRPKTGFGAPVRTWVRYNLDDKINDYLSPNSLKARGIFNHKTVWKLIKDNKSGKIDASYSIWALLAIESWLRQFVDE